MRNRSRQRRLRIVGLGVAVALGVTVGCSGDDADGAQEALDELGIGDSPAVVIAVAIERPDAEMVLDPELSRGYLRLVYAAQGYTWADAGCAVDRAVDTVGADTFATLSLGVVANLVGTYPDTEAAARDCASPESLGRLDVVASEGEKRPATPATDVDGAAIRDLFEGLYRASAEGHGITAAEVDCAIDKVLGPRSDDDLAAVVETNRQIDPANDADEVATCFSTDRIDQLVPELGQALLDARAEANKEHDRKQAEIDAQVDAMNQSTTVP